MKNATIGPRVGIEPAALLKPTYCITELAQSLMFVVLLGVCIHTGQAVNFA